MVEHEQVSTNGITLHVAQAGPEAGPLVILLHGFPEGWFCWRRQIPFLAAAGYRVWAPDQRGYNLSDKPPGVSAYALDELVADIVGLIDAAQRDRALIIGHDWGAAVAWWLAAHCPERIARMVVMNVPHPTVMNENLNHNVVQLIKSWYVFFFQLPWLPEAIAPLNDWEILTQLLQRSSHPGTFSSNDLDVYCRAWSQPNAYTSMVNWYRAVLQHRPAPLKHPRITVPTLLLWGARDLFLGREMVQPSIDFCDDGQLVWFEDATHWLHHEKAERVNPLIQQFFDKQNQ